MKVISASSYRDGGSVYVELRDRGVESRYKLDYSFPLDGRPRAVSATREGKTRLIPIGSDEEAEVCASIRGCLEAEYGRDAVRQALGVSGDRKKDYEDWCASQEGLLVDPRDWDDPYPMPFDGIWIQVFDFVEKAHREGKLVL